MLALLRCLPEIDIDVLAILKHVNDNNKPCLKTIIHYSFS